MQYSKLLTIGMYVFTRLKFASTLMFEQELLGKLAPLKRHHVSCVPHNWFEVKPTRLLLVQLL
jgi:hypothetical protein